MGGRGVDGIWLGGGFSEAFASDVTLDPEEVACSIDIAENIHVEENASDVVGKTSAISIHQVRWCLREQEAMVAWNNGLEQWL